MKWIRFEREFPALQIRILPKVIFLGPLVKYHLKFDEKVSKPSFPLIILGILERTAIELQNAFFLKLKKQLSTKHWTSSDPRSYYVVLIWIFVVLFSVIERPAIQCNCNKLALIYFHIVSTNLVSVWKHTCRDSWTLKDLLCTILFALTFHGICWRKYGCTISLLKCSKTLRF